MLHLTQLEDFLKFNPEKINKKKHELKENLIHIKKIIFLPENVDNDQQLQQLHNALLNAQEIINILTYRYQSEKK